MATFPQDQFDDLPDNVERVGAHRGPKVKGRGWIGFVWAIVATAVLIVIGLYTLSRLDSSFEFTLPGLSAGSSATPKPVSTPTPKVTPVTDPTKIKARKITITVLNGTAINGLQNQAGDRLKKAKWTVGSKALASETDIAKTVVYYSNPANEDVAKGILLALGAGTVRLSDAFQGAPITVVLGSDFAG